MNNNKNECFLKDYDYYIKELPVIEKNNIDKLSKKEVTYEKNILSLLICYAVKNNKKEWVLELINKKAFQINEFIDKVQQRTLLASIIHYPFYEDTFKHLINIGAEIYKDAKFGEKFYRSNALRLSVIYGEFTNIDYLLHKNLVNYHEVLNSCMENNSFVLLEYYLYNCSVNEAKFFIIDTQNIDKEARVQKVLNDFLIKLK